MSEDYRYIRVPETPQSLCDNGKPVWTFRQCVRWVINTDSVFNTTGPGIRAGARIESEIDKDIWKLRTEDQQLLHHAMENPKTTADARGNPLPSLIPQASTDGLPAPKRLVLPYMDVVKNASAAPPDDES